MYKYRANNIRCKEKYTGEPLVPGSWPSEAEIPIANLKNYKSPRTDQIPSELIQAGCETLVGSILIKKNGLGSGRSQSLYQFTDGR
jgi:hypothetical protein